MLDAIVAAEGEPDLVQISGGEPTIHPRFFEILEAARARAIRHLMVKHQRDQDRPGAGVRRAAGHVPAALRGLPAVRLAGRRGADGSARRPAAGVRRRALEALEAAGISTTLVVTVK